MSDNKKSYPVKLLIKTRAFRRNLQKKLSWLSLPEYTTFSMFSVLIGAAVGLAAVFFHDAIEFFNRVFFEQTKEGLFFLGAAAVVVIPALGMLIQALMIYSSPDIAKKKGVSEVIKSVALRGGFIPLKTTLFHFIAPVICIGSGNTVGPEGPAAQLGGGVASKIGNLFSLSDERRRTYTAAGSGAAIAAIFNTPLGGVFFALEIVLLNDFHTPTITALILASVTASAISRVLLGNESVFVFDQLNVGSYSDLYIYALLGLFAGIVSILFIRYSSYIQHLFKDKILKKSIPQWAVMVFVGLLVGISGFFYKEIFGIGYTAINKILAASLDWHIVLILLGLKFILVPLVIYSGGFGGMFAPALFMGACIGYLFSVGANNLLGMNVDPATIILVSMGATLGGINTIPISAILIIFEMTQDYTFILPLMLAVIVSTMLVQITFRGSVHLMHLEAEGFKLTEGRGSNVLKSILVKDVNLDKIDLLPEETKLPEIVSKMMESPSNSFYTINIDGKISGIITDNEIRPIITEYQSVKDMLVARDIINPQVTIVNFEDDLDYVLNLFGKQNVDQFPVIDHNKKILGAIKRQTVLAIYNKETLKENLSGGLANELKTLDKDVSSKVAEGYSIIEKPVPRSFLNKSLSELKLRSTYGLEVLMIKKRIDIFSERKDAEIISPHPDYRFRETDILVLMGTDEKIENFRRLFE